MWRYFIPIALIVILMAFFWRGLYLHPGVIPSPLIGKSIPVFSLPGVDGPSTALDSKDFHGHVSILNVWATWCIPCRDEHPVLVDLSKQKVVTIYGLNYKDKADDAKQLLQMQGDPYTLDGFDPKGAVALNFGVYGVPETFVVDANGVIRKKYVGPLTDSMLKSSLIPLVESLRREKP